MKAITCFEEEKEYLYCKSKQNIMYCTVLTNHNYTMMIICVVQSLHRI